MQNTTLYDTQKSLAISCLLCASSKTYGILLTILDNCNGYIIILIVRFGLYKIKWVWEGKQMIIKWEIMNYENIALFLITHVGGDDKLWINLAWPYLEEKLMVS